MVFIVLDSYSHQMMVGKESRTTPNPLRHVRDLIHLNSSCDHEPKILTTVTGPQGHPYS